MKLLKIVSTVAMVACALAVQQAGAISLDFSSVANNGAKVDFKGNSLSFLNASSGPDIGYGFSINGSTGVGDSVGDLGKINNPVGGFTIGSITTVGSVQSANVTGTGQLVISDGAFTLTGNLTWKTIQTDGTAGALNISGLLNVTSISYSGSQLDLKSLAASLFASDVVDFTFNPAESLTQLTSGGDHRTTYSGSITAPDGGLTLSLLGFALVGIEGLRRKLGK